ncbi:twin-arginine translocase TatA/TatE family subunit [Clostridium formicaceticum]|uniref:Sec-independent protein translocase protein TatA n=1 Tax=Clostridium formicaceticum TaxID=1497 RepID=A0AAC9RJN7_9CLOT|nr:twin-arginine translocase TatA/TatE family subunit [Clostridium formicaceticum]AOY77743.1 Sec-independent protein translocase TatA [Clostridium formicaceticum]ARE88341.1 Sec-independent protein translocase protein TatAd [Clostridium formicaceticum]
MPNIGLAELVIILSIALIVFGPGKLPDVGHALGKSLREFKIAKDSVFNDVNDALEKEKNEQETIK